jgi:hypothetical protein
MLAGYVNTTVLVCVSAPPFIADAGRTNRLSVIPARTLLRGVEHPKNLNQLLPDPADDEIGQVRSCQHSIQCPRPWCTRV